MLSSLTYIVALHIQISTLSDAQRSCIPPSDSVNPQNNGQNGNLHQDSPRYKEAEKGPPEPASARKRCCPYDFDSSRCEVVNDRLLCGYNRNPGRPHSNDMAIQLSGGCRLRGGRLECGYEHYPFTPIRRPPGWDDQRYSDDTDREDTSNDKVNDKSYEILGLKGKSRIFLKTTPQMSPYKLVTKCTEVNDHFVCKVVKPLK